MCILRLPRRCEASFWSNKSIMCMLPTLTMCAAAQKPSILLSARVHPGETQGSWAIQSCIEFLVSCVMATIKTILSGSTSSVFYCAKLLAKRQAWNDLCDLQTSNLPEANLLRSRFTIYVVPMLNPDGYDPIHNIFV